MNSHCSLMPLDGEHNDTMINNAFKKTFSIYPPHAMQTTIGIFAK
jgi:hypothetical protein